MLQVYRYLTYFIFPWLVILIYLRKIFNKEDKTRFKEKIFSSHFNISRDYKKKLVWFHAVSIGECLSILPLIKKLSQNNNNLNFLITSSTLSSSKLLKEKINRDKNVIHRFFPLDVESISENFLNAWKPDIVCFVDSEIWPNFLFKIKEKNIPLLLINARLTKKTFKKWSIVLNFAKKVFNNFDLCLSASEESKNNLSQLEVKKLNYIGNLKYSAQSISDELNNADKKILNNYKTWCAASTHNGEENIIFKAHLEIKKKYKNVLTIIVPRHINRCKYVNELSKKFNLSTQILNDKDVINTDIEILIINSFGVMPKYFNYCKNIFIGKSFIKEMKNDSGQNPIEADKLGCKVLHGPYVYNFQEVYDFLNSYGLTEKVNNEQELANKIIENFEIPTQASLQQLNLLNIYGEKILNETVKEISNYLK